MALVVVLLSTAFIAEFFVVSGLELRSLQTFRDAGKARGMARLAFKALQAGLLVNQTVTMRELAPLQASQGLIAIPWQGGLLARLAIQPQDHLFNLNDLQNLRPGQAKEIAGSELFRKIMESMEIPSQEPGLEPTTLPPDVIGAIYGAIFDWIDKDQLDYVGFADGPGAEQSSYLGADPEFDVKNGRLDSLTEIRLIRGVVESRVPWATWRKHFAALPTTSKTVLYPGRLNVNLTTQEELIDFLKNRQMDDPNVLRSATEVDTQVAINAFADHAEEIVEVLFPSELARPTFTDTSLKQTLQAVQGINTKYIGTLFATSTEYFRVSIETEMNGVEGRLEALLRFPRAAGGSTKAVEVISLTIR